MKQTKVKLNSGQDMPMVGFGVWQITDQKSCAAAVKTALEAGYGHVDTAQIYGNEQWVSEGIKAAGAKREDVFITTKISIYNFLKVEKSFAESLRRLNTDYVDLLLLHYPVTGLRGKAWRSLEKIHAGGGARSIGVSNYTIRHLQQLLKNCRVKPAVNQVELHVFLQQPELLKFCREQGIVVQAYSPLAHGHGLDNEVLAEIGKKHGKTPAQVMLRWCIEAGTVPLPKSATPERIRQNFDILDFELDKEDMQKIKELEQGLRTCWDPTRTP